MLATDPAYGTQALTFTREGPGTLFYTARLRYAAGEDECGRGLQIILRRKEPAANPCAANDAFFEMLREQRRSDTPQPRNFVRHDCRRNEVRRMDRLGV